MIFLSTSSATISKDNLNAIRLLYVRCIQQRTMDLAGMAKVLPLKIEDIKDSFFAGAGLGYCFVQLSTKEAIDRAVFDN